MIAGFCLLAAVPTLRPGPGLLPAGTRVSAVVPARDEEATLPVLLRSLARLAPGPHEVIVVDDGSTDRTAAVAAALGARVIAASPPPDGWLGKPWACQVGADAATGTHLLFLDADTWLARDALDRLMGEQGLAGGLLSVQPHHVTVRPHEELSAVCNVVTMMGTGAFTRRAAGRPAARVAFGPCLLATAADHRAVGGHAAVRGEVVEDVRLARRYRAAGLPVRCLAGGDTVRFRMYPAGLGQLVEGWSKNLAAGAGTTRPLVLAGAVAWVAAAATAAVDGVAGLAGWVGGGPVPVLGLAAWLAVAAQLRWMLRRLGTFRRWTALAFPVPLAAFLAIFARSLVLTVVRRQVTWRSRRIAVGGRAAG